MEWQIAVSESVLEDVRWFGRTEGRQLLRTVKARLIDDPTAETRNIKTLRPNPFAQRELRLAGGYRALLNVDAEAQLVTVLAIGEIRGNRLFVRGEEFTAHHESDPTK